MQCRSFFILGHSWDWANRHLTTCRPAFPTVFQMCTRAVCPRVKRPEPWSDRSPPRILWNYILHFLPTYSWGDTGILDLSFLAERTSGYAENRREGWLNGMEGFPFITLYHSMQCNFCSWDITLKESKKGADYGVRLVKGTCNSGLTSRTPFHLLPTVTGCKAESRTVVLCTTTVLFVCIFMCLYSPV
jgi:hypothetical protein